MLRATRSRGLRSPCSEHPPPECPSALQQVQRKRHFGGRGAFAKQYRGVAKRHLGTGEVFPGATSSRCRERIHSRLCKVGDPCIRISPHFKRLQLWLFHVDRTHWPRCIGARCALEVGWLRGLEHALGGLGSTDWGDWGAGRSWFCGSTWLWSEEVCGEGGEVGTVTQGRGDSRS